MESERTGWEDAKPCECGYWLRVPGGGVRCPYPPNSVFRRQWIAGARTVLFLAEMESDRVMRAERRLHCKSEWRLQLYKLQDAVARWWHFQGCYYVSPAHWYRSARWQWWRWRQSRVRVDAGFGGPSGSPP